MTKFIALMFCLFVCIMLACASNLNIRTRRLQEGEEVVLEDALAPLSAVEDVKLDDVSLPAKVTASLPVASGRIYIPEAEESEFVSVDEVELEGVNTAAPTETPSYVPSAAPSATPTAAPSATPTATPTVTPTRTPTRAPTVGVTTAAPVLQPTTVPILKFTSNLTLTGLTSTVLTTADQQAVVNATALSMNITVNYVTYTKTIPVASASPSVTVTLVRTQSGASVIAVTTTTIPTIDPTTTYNTLTTSLKYAVGNGTFSGFYQSACNYYDGNSCSAECDQVTNSNPTVISPQSDNNDDDKLSDGEIAGAVIGSVAGAALLSGAAYYVLTKKREGFGNLVQSHTGASNKASNDVDVVL